MTIREYLNTKPMARVRRGLGRESDWLEFCDLQLPSGVLYVFDPGLLPGEVTGCTIEICPGHFAVSGKVITYWKDSRISRLRISLRESSPTLGSRAGSVATDLGLIGVADHVTYFAVWNQDRDAFQRSLSAEIPESGSCKIATLGAGSEVVLPFVESGFGDGRYSVYKLEDAGRRVGAEVVFIKPDKQYPF